MHQNDNKNLPEDLDVSQATFFLSLLDEESNQFTFEIIEEPKPTDKTPIIHRYIGSFEEHIEALIQANLKKFGIFFTVNATDGKGRKKENIIKVRALFVDLDGSPLEPITQSPLEPHILIESSPGRYHAYWFVEDIPLEHFECAQKQLAQHFKGDPSVCDLPRLMRLPGFLHRKNKPVRSQIIASSGTRPYKFEELQRAFKWNLQQKDEDHSSKVQNLTEPMDTDTLSKLRDLGLLKKIDDKNEGRWLIHCPWAKEHSNGGEAYYYSKTSTTYLGEGFKCFHAHCNSRDIRSLRFFLGLPPAEGQEALPLFRQMPPPLPFPVEALGPILSQAAKELHKTIKAPLAVIAQSLLGAASLVVQGHANVEIDGRTIALSLFLITVAESGERKSAVDDVVLSAVLEWQASLWGVYREERCFFEEKLEEWKNAKKRCSSTIIPEEMTENTTEPIPPIMPILIIEEPTYEGLVKYLEHGQPSVGLFSDEGGRFFGGNAMNRENLLKTLAGLSSLWDAKRNKPITRIRSGDKSLALYGRRVALHLMIQESVYSKLSEQSMCESQGFLPRCLISFPESMAGSRNYVSVNPRGLPGVRLFREHCNTLLDRHFPSAPPPSPENQLEPPSIPLSEDAHKCWVQFHDSLEKKLGKNGIYHPIRRFGSKSGEHVLRITGVLAFFEDPSTIQIGPQYIERAISIMEYYLQERLRLESYCYVDPSLLTAQKVLDWAKSKGKTVITLKELYQYGPTEVRSKQKALTIVQILESHNRAFSIPAHEVQEGSKGKAWRLIWPDNP